MNKAQALKDLEIKWSNCMACPLHKTRKNVVFGEGNPNADLMLIGAGPGKDEDAVGRPFRGIAGSILGQFLHGAKLSRENDVYITNIVSCYPQIERQDERSGKVYMDYRDPKKEERVACRERLMETIYIVDPLLIVVFGKIAMQALTGKGTQMTSARGQILTMHMQGRQTELRYAVMPVHDLGSLATSSDHVSPHGYWAPTIKDFATICNVLDYLREKYYGIAPPEADRVPVEEERKEPVDDEEDRED
jgi:uracil-DNA glycosylase family 4